MNQDRGGGRGGQNRGGPRPNTGFGGGNSEIAAGSAVPCSVNYFKMHS